MGAAVQKLPATGEIRFGPLDWRGTRQNCSPRDDFWRLTWTWTTPARSIPPPTCKLSSARTPSALFRCSVTWEFLTPAVTSSPFNRTELEPLWGAWAMECLFIAGAVAAFAFLLSWWLLATIYFLPVWLLGFFANRDLNFRQSWRLAGAALLPGALLMAAGILLYGFGFLDLVSLRIHLRRAFCARLDLSVREPAVCAASAHCGQPGKPVRPPRRERT